MIGIGLRINKDELDIIVSDFDFDYVIFFKFFEEINILVENI